MPPVSLLNLIYLSMFLDYLFCFAGVVLMPTSHSSNNYLRFVTLSLTHSLCMLTRVFLKLWWSSNLSLSNTGTTNMHHHVQLGRNFELWQSILLFLIISLIIFRNTHIFHGKSYFFFFKIKLNCYLNFENVVLYIIEFSWPHDCSRFLCLIRTC